MKTKLIATILLLVIIAFLFASEDATEQEECYRKKQELDLLAERFKAETGFTGEIQYSYEHMSLGVFEGRFAGITISSEADTTAFRAVFNQILDKVLPYSKATKNQLSMGKIRNTWGRIGTDYYQKVNGYKVEGAGRIIIGYDSGRNRYIVGNNAVTLPEIDFSRIISKTQAEEIALHDKNDSRYKKAQVRLVYYTNQGSNEYYLAYLVIVSDDSNPIMGDYVYYINALNGNIMLKHKETFIHSDVSVRVMGNDYFESHVWNVPPTVCFEEPMNDVGVVVNPVTLQTNQAGYAYFYDVSDSTKTVKLANALFKMTCSNDTLNAISHTLSLVDSLHHYTINLPDSSYYAANAYIEVINHVNSLTRLNDNQNYFQNHLNIVIFSQQPDPNAQTYGGYSPRYGFIWLRDGRHSDIVRHELSHHFIHRKIGVYTFDYPDTIHTEKGAMDEAGANYLGGAPTDNSILAGISDYSNMATVISMPATSTLNEDQYAKYENGRCIASAWWSLRNNQYFGQVEPGINVVDTLVVRALLNVASENDVNSDYRFKPRYFYNILMKLVDTDNEPLPMNAKQLAINAAYSSRGFKFNPKVESISEANSSRNIFGLNEPVHVKVSNCPQNTKMNIYVIKHGTYTYTDGAPVTDLSNFYAHGFTPITNVTTSPTGEWSGLIWTTPSSAADAEGDYDIIVDIGSPSTPDGKIHYAFSAANVMDGFDGRTAPGFKVTDKNIDLVIAMDLSTSIHENVLEQVVKTGQIIVSQLINGDRVNVYGYGHKYYPNWTPNEILRNIMKK